MAKIEINIGTSADSGTGDTLRTIGTTVESNFSEVYSNGFFVDTSLANNVITTVKISNSSITVEKLDSTYLNRSYTTSEFDDLISSIGTVEDQIAVFCDRKATGTGGGTAANTSAYIVRTLNTTLQNDLTGAILNANSSFTLNPGTYNLKALAPTFGVETSQAWIYCISNNTPILYGTTEYGNQDSQYSSKVTGILTITANTTFELRQKVFFTNATYGLGACDLLSWAQPIYSIIKIQRLK